MIQSITTRGFKAAPECIVLASRGLALVGPNGSGKSSVLDALRFAILGYVDRVGKQPSATIGAANGAEICVRVDLDDGRYFMRTASGTTKSVPLASWIDASNAAASHHFAILSLFGSGENEVAEMLDVQSLLRAGPSERARRLSSLLSATAGKPLAARCPTLPQELARLGYEEAVRDVAAKVKEADAALKLSDARVGAFRFTPAPYSLEDATTRLREADAARAEATAMLIKAEGARRAAVEQREGRRRLSILADVDPVEARRLADGFDGERTPAPTLPPPVMSQDFGPELAEAARVEAAAVAAVAAVKKAARLRAEYAAHPVARILAIIEPLYAAGVEPLAPAVAICSETLAQAVETVGAAEAAALGLSLPDAEAELADARRVTKEMKERAQHHAEVAAKTNAEARAKYQAAIAAWHETEAALTARAARLRASADASESARAQLAGMGGDVTPPTEEDIADLRARADRATAAANEWADHVRTARIADEALSAQQAEEKRRGILAANLVERKEWARLIAEADRADIEERSSGLCARADAAFAAAGLNWRAVVKADRKAIEFALSIDGHERAIEWISDGEQALFGAAMALASIGLRAPKEAVVLVEADNLAADRVGAMAQMLDASGLTYILATCHPLAVAVASLQVMTLS